MKQNSIAEEIARVQHLHRVLSRFEKEVLSGGDVGTYRKNLLNYCAENKIKEEFPVLLLRFLGILSKGSEGIPPALQRIQFLREVTVYAAQNLERVRTYGVDSVISELFLPNVPTALQRSVRELFTVGLMGKNSSDADLRLVGFGASVTSLLGSLRCVSSELGYREHKQWVYYVVKLLRPWNQEMLSILAKTKPIYVPHTFIRTTENELIPLIVCLSRKVSVFEVLVDMSNTLIVRGVLEFAKLAKWSVEAHGQVAVSNIVRSRYIDYVEDEDIVGIELGRVVAGIPRGLLIHTFGAIPLSSLRTAPKKFIRDSMFAYMPALYESTKRVHLAKRVEKIVFLSTTYSNMVNGQQVPLLYPEVEKAGPEIQV